jgi:hypothetical protein
VSDFVPIEDVHGPSIIYHADPKDIVRVIVLSEHIGAWPVDEKAQTEIQE